MGLFRLTRYRVLRLVLAVLISFCLVSSYIYLKSRPSYALYHELNRLEIHLSHQLVKESSEKQRYVRFRQLQGAGFSNQAQEILLFHHLALSTSRAYVYQPVVWRPRGERSLVPLSAFFRGPTRNTISEAVFSEVCLPGETTHVRLRTLDFDVQWPRAVEVLNGPERCVVVDDWILNWNYLASPAIHILWPSFKQYLAVHFEWSVEILQVVDRAQKQLSLRSQLNKKDGNPYMALHFRRGDFEDHCHSLAQDRIGFTTWASLPLLSDSIFPPALDPNNATSTLEHCYPDISRIVAIIDTYAQLRPHLRTLHVLHDGAWDHPLVYYQTYQLEAALKTAGRVWPGGPMKHVTHSGMVPLRWGESDFAVAADVELARNAEVFIGNGFSSLSSQVAALRLGADGGRTEDITLM